MDWDLAIEAHLKWKTRLKAFIDGTGTEKLDSAVVCLDNRCDLGKWIYECVGQHGSDADFQKLKSTHADFHKAAGGIVELVEKGDKAGANAKLTDGLGAYGGASTNVVNKIRTFRKKVG